MPVVDTTLDQQIRACLDKLREVRSLRYILDLKKALAERGLPAGLLYHILRQLKRRIRSRLLTLRFRKQEDTFRQEQAQQHQMLERWDEHRRKLQLISRSSRIYYQDIATELNNMLESLLETIAIPGNIAGAFTLAWYYDSDLKFSYGASRTTDDFLQKLFSEILQPADEKAFQELVQCMAAYTRADITVSIFGGDVSIPDSNGKPMADPETLFSAGYDYHDELGWFRSESNGHSSSRATPSQMSQERNISVHDIFTANLALIEKLTKFSPLGSIQQRELLDKLLTPVSHGGGATSNLKENMMDLFTELMMTALREELATVNLQRRPKPNLH